MRRWIWLVMLCGMLATVCVALQPETASDARLAIVTLLNAAKVEDRHSLDEVIAADNKEQMELAAAYRERVLAYRRLIRVSIKRFPGEGSQFPMFLAFLTNDNIDAEVKMISSANVEVRGEVTRIMIKGQAITVTEIHGRWQVQVESLFHLAPSASSEEKALIAAVESQYAALATDVANDMENGKYRLMADAMTDLQRGYMGIVTSEIPKLKPSTKPSTQPIRESV